MSAFARIIQRKRLGQIFLREHLRIQPIRDLVVLSSMMPQAMLVYALPTDAMAGSASRFPAVILFVDQIAVTGDQQPAVLAGPGGVLEGPVELRRSMPAGLANLRRIRQGCAIRPRYREAENNPERAPAARAADPSPPGTATIFESNVFFVRA